MDRKAKDLYLRAFGHNVRRLRENINMSQDTLALKCGYKSRSTINKIELGINDIPCSKLQVIADALRVKPSILLEFDETISFEDVQEPFNVFDSMEDYLGNDVVQLTRSYLELNTSNKNAVLTLAENLSGYGKKEKSKKS